MKSTLERQIERIENQSDIKSKAFARWLFDDGAATIEGADLGLLNLVITMADWNVLVDPGPQVNALVDKWLADEGEISDAEFKESGAPFTYTAILWQIYDQMPQRFRLPDSESWLLALSMETLVTFGGMKARDITPARCRFIAELLGDHTDNDKRNDEATDEECREMAAILKEALQARIAAEAN